MTRPSTTFEGLHEWLRSAREEAAVQVDHDNRTVQLFGYPEVYTALTETGDFSSDLNELAPRSTQGDVFAEGNFINLDPPRHDRLRGLVSRAFTPKVIAGLQPRITEVTDGLLAAAGTEFDLVDALAYPLPVIVIAELLGIPTDDRPLFRKWADTLLSQQAGDFSQEQLERTRAQVEPTMRELNEYLLGHIRARRAAPVDDLTSQLTAAEADGRALTDGEIIGFAGLLLIAGHITTTALLGNSIQIMNEHPEIAGQLRADRELIPQAVEEFLRYRSPFPMVGRLLRGSCPSAGCRSRRTTWFSRGWPRPTATRAISTHRTQWTSTASRTSTCPSAREFTSASAPHSPAWRRRWR